MKTLIKIKKELNTEDIFLGRGVIEKFHGNTYTCIDYDDDYHFLEMEYKNDNFRIERTNLDLTEEQIDRVYAMLMEFIKNEEEPTFETETPFHPYNQAI